MPKDMRSQVSMKKPVGHILGFLCPLISIEAAWARPFLEVTMTMGLSVSPDYHYIVAISREGSSGPRANLINPEISIQPGQNSFVDGWDYLIRVKPLNDESVLQATRQEPGQEEVDFLTGFNEVTLTKTTREQDTINWVIDLSEFPNLDPVNQDIQVALLTTKAPFRLDPEETHLTIDATRGTTPHYYRLSLSDQKTVEIKDPQRQETVRRSRDLIGSENVTVRDSIEGGALGILSANILTFQMELEDR
jgi:hypothetical protein